MSPTDPLDDTAFDWRIEDMGKVAPPHPYAGRRIMLVSIMKDVQRGFLSYTTPSPASLALDVALNAAAMAETLKALLSLLPSRAPSGEPVQQYSQECLGNLYNFFEQSMIAVTMSFQALELFANSTIGRRLKGTVRVKHRKQERELDVAGAERTLSTEEKLSQVLPALLGVPTPSRTHVWHEFNDLKKARDSAVHLKSVDMYSNYETVDLQSLFFVFLDRDVRQYPRKALSVIDHFFPDRKPRWLAAAKEIANKDSASTS